MYCYPVFCGSLGFLCSGNLHGCSHFHRSNNLLVPVKLLVELTVELPVDFGAFPHSSVVIVHMAMGASRCVSCRVRLPVVSSSTPMYIVSPPRPRPPQPLNWPRPRLLAYSACVTYLCVSIGVGMFPYRIHHSFDRWGRYLPHQHSDCRFELFRYRCVYVGAEFFVTDSFCCAS